MRVRLFYKDQEVHLVNAHELGVQIESVQAVVDQMGLDASGVLLVEVISMNGARLFPVESSHGARANGARPVVFFPNGTVSTRDLRVEFDMDYPDGYPIGPVFRGLLRSYADLVWGVIATDELEGRHRHLALWRLLFWLWLYEIDLLDTALKERGGV